MLGNKVFENMCMGKMWFGVILLLGNVILLFLYKKYYMKFVVVDVWIWYGYFIELMLDGDILNMVDLKCC